MKYKVHISGETQSLAKQDLLGILEALLPINFTVSMERGDQVAGEIFADGCEEPVHAGSQVPISSLRVPRAPGQSLDRGLTDLGIRFADDAAVPFPFRGLSLRTKVAAEPGTLSLSADEKLLASSEAGPVWSIAERGGVKHCRSAFRVPCLPAGGNLHDVLNGERYLEMLPLIHWLRELCSPSSFEGPPLRACFIFDDPNLHWPRYGFVDFGQIAAHAEEENYHVSFATIPLDTWFAHKGTVEIFRRNATRLSLAVHGNNHTKQELARCYTEAKRVALLRQAVHRIERLESASGLDVSRVMVPPHGACSDSMLSDLPRCGFEAACISHGSLRAHNRASIWARHLGYLPSEIVQGCPVLPRLPMSGEANHAILLAAFLNQPMILRGHHQDLRDGVELLDQLAGLINGLGSILWSNLADLSRSNYQWRMEGVVCRVKPLSRKVTFPIPNQARQLIIENPCDDTWERWQITGLEGATIIVFAGVSVSLSAAIHHVISIESAPAVSVDGVPNRSASVAFFRRLLTEGRDRFLS